MKKSFYILLLYLFLANCDSSSNSTDDIIDSISPTVLTTQITNITYNSADSGGNELNENGSAITQKGVCWSVQPNTPTINDSHTIDGSGSAPYMSSLIDLEPNTQYFVRSYAINEAGIGYGEKLAFATTNAPGTPPCNPLVNTSVFNSLTQNYSSVAGDANLQYGLYGVIGSTTDSSLHIEFKEAPMTGIYESVEENSTLFNSSCVIYATLSDAGGEEFFAAAEDLVYVVKNGEGQYSVTFCDVVLYSTTSTQSVTMNANLTTE